MGLDPDLQRLLQALPGEVQLPVDWVAARQASAAMVPMLAGPDGPAPVGSVEDRRIAGPAGAIDLRIYRPEGEPVMTLIHFHGGGWALGGLDTCDHTVRKLCRRLGAVVVSCSYRLAPEHPFPAAYDDALAATRWVLSHVDELGMDPQRVVIAGDSAGGNLVAAVTIALRDAARRDVAQLVQPLPQLRAQLLLYPGVDVRATAFEAASFVADADPSLPVISVGACIDAYTESGQRGDWRASPLAASDLSCLPPALVVVLSVDPLRDQGVSYAARLVDNGVHCELIEYPHLTHGFVHLAALVPAATLAFDGLLAQFEHMLAFGARPG
jgi:acetyl esterase